MFKKNNYDKKYSQKSFYWGLGSDELILRSVKYLPGLAKVLDLGCGEGRNSHYLAKKGFVVTAVDKSEIGINKLSNLSEKENLKIKKCVSDAQLFLNDCGNFDAIYAINVLQFIDQKNILSVIKKIQSKTKTEGLNVISSFIAENEKQKKEKISQGRYAFNKGELRELYKNWKIVFYEEKLGKWETHGEQRHRHFLVKMMAQKL